MTFVRMTDRRPSNPNVQEMYTLLRVDVLLTLPPDLTLRLAQAMHNARWRNCVDFDLTAGDASVRCHYYAGRELLRQRAGQDLAFRAEIMKEVYRDGSWQIVVHLEPTGSLYGYPDHRLALLSRGETMEDANVYREWLLPDGEQRVCVGIMHSPPVWD
jgi:hypothetical protein